MILKSDLSWTEICSILSENAGMLDDPYFADAIAAHCRVRQLDGNELAIAQQLLRRVLNSMPESQKGEALNEVGRHLPSFESASSDKLSLPEKMPDAKTETRPVNP